MGHVLGCGGQTYKTGHVKDIRRGKCSRVGDSCLAHLKHGDILKKQKRHSKT